jgi:hypothetical protein
MINSAGRFVLLASVLVVAIVSCYETRFNALKPGDDENKVREVLGQPWRVANREETDWRVFEQCGHSVAIRRVLVYRHRQHAYYVGLDRGGRVVCTAKTYSLVHE